MEAHVDVKDMLISEGCALREKLERILEASFDINHITLQLECGECEDMALIKNSY